MSEEFLDTQPFQRVNKLFGCRYQAADLIISIGEQIVLNGIPSLHDQVASGSIQMVGVAMLIAKIQHTGNGYPRLTIFPAATIKFPNATNFAKSAYERN